MTVEIAVQDVEGARIAHEEGADRVELCAALMGTGGLTPSFGMIQACSHVGVPQGVQVLIRPRGGSFVFTDEEKYVQIADVRSAILAGASGVVVGGMTEDGRIDVPFTRALAEAARNEAVRCNRKVQVTYHRAFDMLDDQFAALDTLIELGFTRVLTSGGAACVPDGLGRLRELSEYAAGRIQIQAGGGVTVDLHSRLEGDGRVGDSFVGETHDDIGWGPRRRRQWRHGMPHRSGCRACRSRRRALKIQILPLAGGGAQLDQRFSR